MGIADAALLLELCAGRGSGWRRIAGAALALCRRRGVLSCEWV